MKLENDIVLEIMSGQAGLAVYLNGIRIAGVRDNGLMKQKHAWRVRREDVKDALDLPK